MSLLAVGHAGAPLTSLLHVGVVAHNEILAHGIQALVGAAPGVSTARLAADDAADPAQERFDIVILSCDGFATHEVERITAAATARGAKVVLVVRPTRADLLDCLGTARSSGVLVQDELTADLLSSALRRVDRGETYVATSLAGVLVANIRSAAAEPRRSALALTARERQVLGLLAEGLSNKLIAQRVYLSSHGVKKVVAGLLAKFDCPNRTQLVALALRDGLIPPAGTPVGTPAGTPPGTPAAPPTAMPAGTPAGTPTRPYAGAAAGPAGTHLAAPVRAARSPAALPARY